MKIDGLDWMDWLHKVRREAEEKRIREGLSVEQWLHQVRVSAVESRERRRSHEYPTVARDKPGTRK
jgi:hypothetical protein